MSVAERIKGHEGCRLKPYRDSLGIWTVGYGRNLEAVEFTQAEVDFMFATDYDRAVRGARTLPVYAELNEVRQGVLVEMVFQLGLGGVKKFKNFLAAALVGRWQRAHDEMLFKNPGESDEWSDWRKQTPRRAEELAGIFRNG